MVYNISCSSITFLITESITLNLPGKPHLALSVLSGIWWDLISGYIRYPESGKKMYPVHPYSRDKIWEIMRKATSLKNPSFSVPWHSVSDEGLSKFRDSNELS